MLTKQLLYIEVANDIKKDIFTDKYQVGEYIPTETELEEKYNVSKITIRRAVEILVQEGYLIKRSGKGTTVISNRPFNKLSKASSFSFYLESIGKTLTKKILSVDEVKNPKIIPEMEELGEKVIKLTRLYYLDEEPYILFNYYLKNIGDYKELENENTSLYNWISKNGVVISNIKDSFLVGKVEDNIKKILDTEHSFLLERHRYSFNNLNKLVEFSQAYYNTSKQKYEIEYEV